MPNQPIRVLLVEDVEDDAELMLLELRRAGFFPVYERTETAEGLRAALVQKPWDVILCDNALLGFDARSVLDIIRQQNLDIPLLVVSGTIGEERAVELMQAGAVDYLMKGKLNRLGPAIERELRELQSRRNRRQAEARQVRNALILANVRDAVVVTDTEGVVTDWNDGATRLFGWTAEDVIGRPYADRYPEPLRSRVAEGIRRRLAGEDWAGEYVTRRKDGTRVWVDARVSRITDSNGKVVGVLGLSHDISDRKRSEAELQASEERLRLAAEAAQFGTFDTNFVNPTIYSKEFKAIFGVAPDAPFELDADQLPIYIHPEDRSRVLAATRAAVEWNESGQSELEHRLIRANDGAVRHVLVRGHTTFTSDGGVHTPVRFTGVVLDLTDRLRAEAALQASEVRYRTLVSATTAMVWNTPSSGKFEEPQPGWTAFTGQCFEELQGWGWLNAVHPDDRDQSAQVWMAAIKERKAYEVEHRLRRADGEYRHMSVRAVPIFGPDQSIHEWVGIHTDITEQRKLEDQFRQAQKMDAVGQLAGGVAHDFNNLLTVINGYGEIVHGALPPDHPSRELVGEIKKAGDRAASLTRQLLAFSRQTVLEPKLLDPGELVRDMERMLRRLIGEDIELSTKLPEDLGQVKADPGQLEQAVMNLCINARDAMPRGGHLMIQTRNVELDAAYFATHPDVQPGPYVVLSVSDTGIGMTAEVQARIFEPFFTTKEKGKGTGLGLAMVFGFVKQSGGHISVHSEPARGSTFNMYLPRIDDAPKSGNSGVLMGSMPRGTETILLVEDEDAVRALGQYVLMLCGYKVLEAAGGREAVKAVEEHADAIHLILTDVVMPGGMGGRQVAEAVLCRHPNAKVLFTSGYTDDAIVRHGVLEDEVAFLQKPFSPASLARKVREVLDGPP